MKLKVGHIVALSNGDQAQVVRQSSKTSGRFEIETIKTRPGSYRKVRDRGLFIDEGKPGFIVIGETEENGHVRYF